MKKHYVSSMLLVCLAISILSIQSFAQVKPPKNNQELPNGPITNIVGGGNTNINVVPWQILLEIQTPNGIITCGGNIVAPSWILTAGHCTDGFQVNQLTVYAGITRRSQRNTGQVRTVTQIIRNPNEDISLIRLNSPLTYNTNVQGINYATPNDDTRGLSNVGRNTNISGWGVLTEDGVQPDILQLAIVPIQRVNAQTLDAGFVAGGVDACQGDSGGPMYVFDSGRPVLIGVTSRGPGCARPNSPGVYVRTSAFCDWISDNITAIENGGSNISCSATTTFNLRHQPFGANVTWTATPASAFVTSSGTGTAAGLRAVSGPAGIAGRSATLTFTANGGCGTTTVSRTLWAGKPGLVTLTGYGNIVGSTVCANQNVTFTASAQAATSYRWSVTGGTASSTSGSQISVYTGSSGGLNVRVTASNSCGDIVSSRSYSIITNGCYNEGGPLSQVIVYPNPVDQLLTVEAINRATAPNDSSALLASQARLQTVSFAPQTNSQTEFSVKLFDRRQYVVREGVSANGKIQIDVSSLSPGIYPLHIIGAEGTSAQQIVVE